MSREAHVRFCESVAVRFLCATRPVAESFFHTLKIELVHHCDYETRDDARASIFEYIEVFYNRQGAHSANGYEAPLAFEAMKKAA